MYNVQVPGSVYMYLVEYYEQDPYPGGLEMRGQVAEGAAVTFSPCTANNWRLVEWIIIASGRDCVTKETNEKREEPFALRKGHILIENLKIVTH